MSVSYDSTLKGFISSFFFLLFQIFQEAHEHCLCGHEPIPHEANPQSALLSPGESPPGADGAGSDPTDFPQGEGDESGQTELCERRRGGELTSGLWLKTKRSSPQSVGVLPWWKDCFPHLIAGSWSLHQSRIYRLYTFRVKITTKTLQPERADYQYSCHFFFPES